MGQLIFIASLDGGGAVGTTNVYLSGANGNDANDGLTPATAVATFSRIWELLPLLNYGSFVVHIGAHGGTGYTYELPPSERFFAAGASIVLYGDGAGQAGEDGFTVIESGVLGAGTTDFQLELAGAPADDAYLGYTIEMVDGAAAGFRRNIRDNVASIAVVTQTYESTAAFISPVAGDSYRVLRPSVRLRLPDSGTSMFFGAQRDSCALAQAETPLDLVNISMEAVENTSFRVLRLEGSQQRRFFGVELTTSTGAFIPMNYADLELGITPAPRAEANQLEYLRLMTAIGHTPVFGDWLGWGMSATSALNSYYNLGGRSAGYMVTPAFIAVFDQGALKLLGGRAQGFFVADLGELILNPQSMRGTANQPIPFLVLASTNTVISVGGQSGYGGRFQMPLSYNNAAGVSLEIRITGANALSMLDFGDGAEVKIWGNISIDAPLATGTVMSCDEGSDVVLTGLNLVQLTAPNAAWAMTVAAGARLTVEAGFSATAVTALGGILVQGGLFETAAGSLNLTCTTSPAIRVTDGGKFIYGAANASALQSAAAGAVVEIERGSHFIQRETSGALTVTNTGAGPAVRVTDGGKFIFGAANASAFQSGNAGGTVEVERGSHFIQRDTAAALTVTNTVGGGYVCSEGSVCNLRGGANNVTSSAAATAAYDARFGGQIVFDAAPNANAGAGGDLIVNTGTGLQAVAALGAAETGIISASNNNSTISRVA